MYRESWKLNHASKAATPAQKSCTWNNFKLFICKILLLLFSGTFYYNKNLGLYSRQTRLFKRIRTIFLKVTVLFLNSYKSFFLKEKNLHSFPESVMARHVEKRKILAQTFINGIPATSFNKSDWFLYAPQQQPQWNNKKGRQIGTLIF